MKGQEKKERKFVGIVPLIIPTNPTKKVLTLPSPVIHSSCEVRMFKTDFLCRIENQTILFNALMLHREAKNALKKKGLSPEQIRQVSDIIIDCQDVFADAHSYPDAGEA
jgi:hypothetical protein